MDQGMWVLVTALASATCVGLYRSLRDGRFRGTRMVRGSKDDAAPAPDAEASGGSGPEAVLAGSGLPYEPGARATLLQFSSAFCAPCRATRRVLTEVATLVPGVVHVEVDAESHLDLVRRLHVLRTPTTLVLDHAGREVSRATGAPSRDAVLGVLARVLDD